MTFLSLPLLVALIFLGVPVAVSLFIVGWILVYSVTGDASQANRLLYFTVDQSLRNYFLSVVPFFVLMGEAFARSGLVDDLFHLLLYSLRQTRTGVLLSVVLGNAVFAAATGVSVVSASLFGRVAAPVMVRSGVRPEVATGLIAGSSVLGMLIPPSILMIVYGLLTDQPIGKLFIAGVVPGVLVVVAYSAYILIMGPRLYERGRNGVSSPDSTVALERVSFGGVFGLVATIVILLGGIYTGIFTVVEAAAIGAALAVASSVVSRRLDLIGIGSALASSVVTTASIGIIFLSANFYSKAIALVGLPGSIQRLLSEADVSRELVLLLVCLVIFALGFVLDTVSTLTIVIPVAYPILTSFNVDLIWFGILAILAAEMGLITPPVGLSVYALKAALPEEADVPVEDIFKGSIPFLLLMILVFTLVFFFPGLLL